MKEIIKRLMENHEIEAEEKDILEADEESPESEEETLEEDWRNGEFTQQDMDRYSKDMFEKARAILFSLDQMTQKHQDFHMDFSKLRNRIKNLF